MMWAAGTLASISSITYPAISAFVSMHSDADKQGILVYDFIDITKILVSDSHALNNNNNLLMSTAHCRVFYKW